MLKRLAALTAAFVVAGSVYAAADEWAEKMKIVDTDGSGTISRTEWEANWTKLKLDPAPTFTAMDEDVNNSIDADEWAKAQKMAKAFPEACKSSSESWCPKQY
ncbi:MAG: hypothetical protein JSR78_06640 [Proteobacteria bacterium]|nr:hypothetical protein [Pseudomonadota bacterium]